MTGRSEPKGGGGDMPPLHIFAIKGPHFMYRILDSKKTSRFQFSIPGLREIHRNLKQQKKFKSCESFFRKIAKMALLNPCMKFKIFFGQKHSFEAL